jgi:hypothetical protein
LRPSISRWAILLLGAGLLAVALAVQMGWLRDPTLAKSDYVGNIDVSAGDAKLYRAVPFEWRVTSTAGSFTGTDTAWIRIDDSGERPVVCGWLRLAPSTSLGAGGGNSIRATRWLSEARLHVGDLVTNALFIAPADKGPGDGLFAGCLRLDEPKRPAIDAPLKLDGSPVPE